MNKLLLLCAAVLIFGTSNAQSLACNGAVDLNITNAFIGAAQPNDPVVNYGCINANGRNVWYGYFTVCSSGSVTIGTSVPSSSDDVDIVVWGPFSTTSILCTQLTAPAVAACAATPGPGETTGLNLVSAGEVYMVAVVADSNNLVPGYGTTGTAVVSGTCPPISNCAPVAGYESLCLVTVDSATQEYKLVWSELAGNPVSHFGILKADYMGVPQLIDTVQISSLSQYIDTSADPNVHTEQYSIMTYDTCGTFWSAAGMYIQPVFCQSSLSTQGTVNVSWSPYIDMSNNGPVYYVIYRGATPANMVSIDTVATFINNYTDINPLPGLSYYKIGTALYAPCVPMRLMQTASVYQVESYSNAAPITVVGMQENSLQEVSLFPNPSDGNLTIRNISAASVLSVYDITGRVVAEQALLPGASQNVSLNGLDAGIYSVTIVNETGYFRDEIIIRH